MNSKKEKSDNEEEDDHDKEFEKIERNIKRSKYTIFPDNLYKAVFDVLTTV